MTNCLTDNRAVHEAWQAMTWSIVRKTKTTLYSKLNTVDLAGQDDCTQKETQCREEFKSVFSLIKEAVGPRTMSGSEERTDFKSGKLSLILGVLSWGFLWPDELTDLRCLQQLGSLSKGVSWFKNVLNSTESSHNYSSVQFFFFKYSKWMVHWFRHLHATSQWPKPQTPVS